MERGELRSRLHLSGMDGQAAALAREWGLGFEITEFCSVLFWRELLADVPESMVLAVENVMEPGPEMLVQIAEQVNDPRLGLCLDVGHANASTSKTPPLAWIAPMAPWLRHVHLHNNAGGWDLHDPLGKGTIPMEQVLDTLLEQCPAATYTIENQDCAPSLDWLAQRGYLEERA